MRRVHEDQQLDDRARMVVNQLKLGQERPQATAINNLAGEPGPTPTDAGDTPPAPAMPGQRPLRHRGSKQPKTKEQWIEQVKEFATADPTGSKATYIVWITKMFLNGSLIWPEDKQKVTDALREFDRQKLKGGFKGDRNIYSYPSFSALYNTVEENRDVKTKAEMVRYKETEGAEVVAEGEAVKVVKDKEGKVIERKDLGLAKVVKVTTPEAGAKLWRHVAWCVKDPNFWGSSYKPPFYMVELNGKPMFLHDQHSMSLKKADDADPSFQEIKPYAKVLKAAGLLDDKKGLEFILGGNARTNRNLAFLAVMSSGDRELIRKAHDHLDKQLRGTKR